MLSVRPASAGLFYDLLGNLGLEMNRRKDSLTALTIDAALHTSSIHGVELAALNMKAYGVRRDVIMRVLTVPRQRRGPGQWAIGPAADSRPALETA
jgi:hypothetical protein